MDAWTNGWIAGWMAYCMSNGRVLTDEFAEGRWVCRAGLPQNQWVRIVTMIPCIDWFRLIKSLAYGRLRSDTRRRSDWCAFTCRCRYLSMSTYMIFGSKSFNLIIFMSTNTVILCSLHRQQTCFHAETSWRLNWWSDGLGADVWHVCLVHTLHTNNHSVFK